VDALPDGRLVSLPDTGHLPMVERPREVVAAIVSFAGLRPVAEDASEPAGDPPAAVGEPAS
jgi:hypothetical protein